MTKIFNMRSDDHDMKKRHKVYRGVTHPYFYPSIPIIKPINQTTFCLKQLKYKQMAEPKKYKHLFFDLDKTIWDFNTNVYHTFRAIFEQFNIHEYCELSDFIKVYDKHNERLWREFRKGNIRKNRLRVKRFMLVFREIGIHNMHLAQEIGDIYIDMVVRQMALLPGARAILEYLSEHYSLHIITNGFEQVQMKKIKNCGLTGYFKSITTSDSTKYKKPSRGIFQHALALSNALAHESLMIGDDMEADIIGARKCKIDQVYFNPGKIPHKKKVTYEISCLEELKQFL